MGAVILSLAGLARVLVLVVATVLIFFNAETPIVLVYVRGTRRTILLFVAAGGIGNLGDSSKLATA